MLFEDDEDGILDRGDMILTFEHGESEYRKDKILKTSSKLVISEFIPFIINKLQDKCTALHTEIETINL